MSDVKSTVKLKALVTETTAVLLTRGLEVEPVAVRDVVAYMVDVLAQQTGMDAKEAVRLVTSETVADAIAKASDQTLDGAAAVHAVRPVRVDVRFLKIRQTIRRPGGRCGGLPRPAERRRPGGAG